MATTPEPASWRTSSYSSNGSDCVEVAPTADGVLIRDTKQRGDGPIIRFRTAQWVAFLHCAAGTDAASTTDRFSITEDRQPVKDDGSATATTWHVHCRNSGSTLHFTPSEWTAFRAGICRGEFNFPALESAASAAAESTGHGAAV